MINYMTSGKGRTMKTVKRSVVAKGWEGGVNRWNKEDFLGSETILCDSVMVDICHYTFVKTHTMYNTKSEP